jgi:hypothetical protein
MSGSQRTSGGELRKHPRIEVPENVIVQDAHSGEMLGQLVNLSVDGLLLVGRVGIAPGTVRQLRMQLKQGGRVTELVLGAESLWCNDANDSGAYWSGFQIIDISPEQQEILDALTGG